MKPKLYIIRKKVRASSVEEALQIEKSAGITDVFEEEDQEAEEVDTYAVGF